MLKSSSPPLRQIPLKRMERGLARPIATLKLEPDEITQQLGLKFDTAEDDLDELQAAVLSGKGGRQFALVRHRHQPNPGTDILINERSRDLSAALRNALETLRLEKRDLKWITPKIKQEIQPGITYASSFRLSAATLREAAQIQEDIERLESELKQLLQSSEEPTFRREKKPANQRKERAIRTPIQAAVPPEQLAPAVVRVLRSHGRPMGVSDILKGLRSNGYKFTSPEPKKNLFARIYRLKGVKQVGPGKFTAS